MGTALAWPSGTLPCASSMGSPVDASSAGDLMGKCGQGEDAGHGGMREG